MIKHATRGEGSPQEVEILRHLADGLPQIIWGARPDGSYEYLKKQWHDYPGLSPDDSTEAAWRELIHPDDRKRADASWAQSLREGAPYDVELRLRRASDGE